MHRFRFVLASLFIGLTMASVLVAQDYYRRVDIFQLVNGLVLGEAKLSGMSTPSAGVVQLGGTDVTTLTSLAGASTRTQDNNGFRHTPPVTQTIGAGGIVAADACGAVKNITAAGAVSTDATNAFTAPAAANTSCTMLVCNVGATNTITLKRSANVLLVGGADVALLGNSCLMVNSNGVVWRQLTAQLTGT